jgi:ATP-dependent DNA ligase
MERLKPQTTIDAVIMGFKPGENGFSGLVGAVVFGQYDENGTLVERGRCSGMDMRTRIDMTQNFESKWMGAVVEIAHMGVSIGEGESGRFRHPQFKRRRTDKALHEVVIHDG